MRVMIVCVLAAGAVTLGACAHAGGESAALSGAEMKAELASVTQQMDEVSRQLDKLRAQSKEDLRQQRVQTRMAAFNAGVVGQTADAVIYERSVEGPLERRTVNSAYALSKLEQLMGRQEELRWMLSRSSDPSAALNADEIRERIASIDKQLAALSPGQTLAPAAGGSGVFRPGMEYIASNTPNYLPTPGFEAARTPIMSTGGRSFAWRHSYSLQRERNDLYARLQALESSQD